MTAINYADRLFYNRQLVDRVYAGSTLVWPPWKPTNLPGCEIWVDISRSANITNGGNVTHLVNWTGRPAPIATGNYVPPTFRTNALNTVMPVMRMTRAGQRWVWTGLNLDKEYTLFIVARRWQLTPGRILAALITNTTSNILHGWHGNEFDCAYQEGWFNTPGPVGGVTSTTAWRLYSGDGTAAGTSRLFSSGFLLGQHPSPPASKGFAGTMCISGYTMDYDDGATSQGADCEVAEVIVYNRKLSDADRQTVENYLNIKWNPFKPFTPTDLGSSLVAWFDGSDTNSVTVTGSGVSQWANKGVGAMTLTQTADAHKPTYNATDKAVNFAIGQIMTPANAPSSFDVIVVSMPNNVSDWRTLLRSAQGHEIIIETGNTRFGIYHGVNGFLQAGTLTWGTAWGLGFARVAANTAVVMSRDGGPLAATTVALQSGDFKPTMFGGYASTPPTQGWGSIKEIIFLPHNFSDGDRQRVEGYLAHKHGLTGLLPASHPYKSTAP
jgi:hypothetical protein